ncbi:hypothetical protein JL722_12310 [Aureococcus anophagefferens]|nr:hypothetical protein JL722_12310 [Aureococcus anophagefferens]KAH8098732.1 hypothetical protein JL720_1695 [Aureococcus anophagefferens]
MGPQRKTTRRGGRNKNASSSSESDSFSETDSEEERQREVQREQWEKFKMANQSPFAQNWELADLVDLVYQGAAERRMELGCAALTIGVTDQYGVPTYLRKMPEVGYTKRVQKERPEPSWIERSLTLNPCIGAAHFADFSRNVPFGTIPVKHTDRDPLQQIGVYLLFRVVLVATALVLALAFPAVRIGAALLDFDDKAVMKRLTMRLSVPVLYMATEMKCLYIRMQGAIPLFTPNGELTGAIGCYADQPPEINQDCLEYGIKFAGLPLKSNSVGYIWNKACIYTQERRDEFIGMNSLE